MGSASHALLHGHWVEATQLHALVLPFHVFLLAAYASLWWQGEDSFLFRPVPDRWAYASVAAVGFTVILLNR